MLGDIAALKDSIGNAGDAASQYQAAISLDPHNVAAYERYAKVYRHVNANTAIEKLEELQKGDIQLVEQVYQKSTQALLLTMVGLVITM